MHIDHALFRFVVVILHTTPHGGTGEYEYINQIEEQQRESRARYVLCFV